MSSSGLAIRLYFTSLVKILNFREMSISKFTSVVCSSIKSGSLHFTLWTWIRSCCGPIGSRRRKRIGQLFWWSFLAAFSTFVAFSIVMTKLRMEGGSDFENYPRMDEKIWRNCFLLCACRTQGRHWVHWLLQICKARSIYYSWGRSAQKRPFQYHWKIDKFTSDLYNPESFCLVTRFDNFGWNPFLIFPDLIRIILRSEKIGEAEAVKSKREEFGLEQSVPLIYIFEVFHIFFRKGDMIE